jgi:hypothetical protein
MYRSTLFLCFIALLGLENAWGQCAEITGFNTGGVLTACPGETINLNLTHNSLSHFGVVYTSGAPTSYGPTELYDVGSYGTNNILPVVLNKLTSGSGTGATTTYSWDIPASVSDTITVYVIFGSGEDDYANATTTCAAKSFFRRNITVLGLDTSMTVNLTPACPGSNSSVQIQGVEAGVSYSVVQIGSFNIVGGPVNGSAGSNVNIPFNTPVNPKNYVILAQSINSTCTDTFGFFTLTPLSVPDNGFPVSDPIVCAGATATVNITNPVPGVTYSLYKPNGSLQGVFNASGVINFMPAVSGNYTVRAVDDTTTCQSNVFPDAAVVSFHPNPTASISGQGLYCNGAPTDPIHFQLTTGATPWTFVYELDDGNTTVLDTIANAAGTQASLPSPAAGCYRLVEVLADGNGCVDNNPTIQQCVVVLDPLDLSSLTVSDDEICADETISLTASLGNPALEDIAVEVGAETIVIEKGSSSASTDPFVPGGFGELSFSTTNTYYLLATQCSVNTVRTATLTRKENLAPPTFLGPDLVVLCEDSNTFAVPIKTPDLIGEPDIDVSLETPDGPIIQTLIADGSAQAITLNTPPPGNYNLVLTDIRYATGESCSPAVVDDELTVTVLEDLKQGLDLSLENTCQGTKIPFTLTRPQSPFKVSLTLDNNAVGLGTQAGNFSAADTLLEGNIFTSQGLPQGSYQFWIKEARYVFNGTNYCPVNNLDSNTVAILDQPRAAFAPSDPTPCVHAAVSFLNNTPNAAQYSYTWDFGDDSTSTALTPLHFFRAVDSFAVKLTARAGNCQDDSVFILPVAPGPEPVEIYQLRKEGRAEVLLVAYDENNRNGDILEYRWRHVSTGVDSVWGKSHTLFLADTTVVPGIWVETRFGSGGNCFAASEIVRQRVALPELAPAMTVYPNPSSGSFRVRISGSFRGQGTLRIMDLTGRLVHLQQLAKTENQVDLKFSDQLAPGQYLLHFSLPDQAAVHSRLTIY